MNNLAVAYDTTILLRRYSTFKSGLARVAEEMLRALIGCADVEITPVSLCGSDLFADALAVEEYTREQGMETPPSIKSRLGLAPLYRRAFKHGGFALSLAYRLTHTLKLDSLSSSLDGFHVFHSSYFKLPARDVTRHAERFLTVYDLIPLDAPHFVTPDSTDFFREIIRSVDTQRDWVLCISEYARQTFCEFTGMSPARAFVTHLAAAPHFAPKDAESIRRARLKYGVPEGDYFLSVGDIQPRKNITRAIRCFERVRREIPDISFLHAGATYIEGDKKEHRDVIFTGYIPDGDLAALYSGATALLFPSLYEGFGLPVLEAMQCGAPVITSNTTSLPEVAGDAAILIKPTDEDALCQSMLDLLRDESLRLKLRRKGLERAALFSWERCADSTVAAYRQALASRSL